MAMTSHTSLYFVGIGGSGMSALAEILHRRGDVTVRGSDLSEGPVVERLRRLGIEVFTGHDPARLGEATLVVVSSAVPADNPEVQEARRRGLPLWTRGQLLARLSAGGDTLAVAGSHGKSTTTWMTASIFLAAGLEPTVMVGGRLPGLGGGALVGRDDCWVIEADESDGSFLELAPRVVIVTNLDREHLQHYGSEASLRAAFARFVASLPVSGLAVLPADDPAFEELRRAARCEVVSFGFSGEADVRAEGIASHDGGTSFTLLREPRRWQIHMPVPGVHNVANAAAAAAAALGRGIGGEIVAQALGRFRPVARRLDRLGEVGGVLFLDDYGHHPTEITATIAAVRAGHPDRRLVVLFQPHRYSRTRELFDEFAPALAAADHVVITDIYAAGEARIKGVEARRLASSATSGAIEYASRRDVAGRLTDLLRQGDVCLALGAGDVDDLARAVMRRRLESDRAAKGETCHAH